MILGLTRIVKHASVVISLQLRRLEKALERSQHADLERRLKSLVAEQFAHLLLNEGDDQTLFGINNANRLVVSGNPTPPPFASILVLREMGVAGADLGHPSHQESLGQFLLAVIVDVVDVEALEGTSLVEDVELVPELPITLLNRRGRQEEDPLGPGAIAWKQSPLTRSSGVAHREAEHPIA